MANYNWKDFLGWNERELKELRFAGFSLYREGKYEKALLFFEALMALDPASTYDIQTCGAIYLQLGNKEKALNLFNQSLTLEPEHELTLLNKAKALLLLQQKTEAFQLLDKLEKSVKVTIANDATALKMAYS